MTEEEITSLQSEAGFRALFENATIGIIVVGQKGGIQLVNPHAEKLFGYSNAELLDKPIETLIPREMHGRHEHHRSTYFDKPRSRPMGLGMDLFASKKDGSIFPVEISLGYYEFAGEKLAMAFINDITLRKEAENKLKQINEQLESRVQERTLELTAALEREMELNDMKSRFVSIASHEFRTPLSAILSSISLIEQYTLPEQQDKRLKHVVRIKAAIKNLTGILNDFLSLDKLEQGKTEVERETVLLKDFIENTAEDIKELLKPGQSIQCKHSGELEIYQDKKILGNVLLNLISNAIKYSPEDENIEVQSSVNNNLVTINVKDAGMGIPADEQRHLFRKFFRARNVSEIQGTGLGLNIVQRYVELMKGRISFTSKPGETIFTVEFPQNAG